MDVREGMRRMAKRRPSHLTVNWCYDLLSWEWGEWKYLTDDVRSGHLHFYEYCNNNYEKV